MIPSLCYEWGPLDSFGGGKPFSSDFLSQLTLSFSPMFFFGGACVRNVGTCSDLSQHSRSALKARGQKIITMGQ